MFDSTGPVKTATISPSLLPDWLLGRGVHFVTTVEIAELVGVAESSVPVSLHRARAANKIVSVTKGAWVPVPPAYRSAAAPPPIHYIDALMRHLGHGYYVGFLSSARIHGASHQVPMVLQVVTPALLRDRRVGDSRIQFIRRSAAAERAVKQHDVDTGRVTVATPETTVLDIVEAPGHAAGLGNVGNVIGELVLDGSLDGDRLADAAVDYPTTVVQRAGWLLAHMAIEVGTHLELGQLQELIADAEYTPLDPRSPVEGRRDATWHVIVNTDVEHDL